MEREDALVVAARRLLYAGLFASSLLAFRVGGYTFGDMLLLVSAAVTSIAPKSRTAPGSLWKLFAVLFVFIGGVLSVSRSLDPGTAFAVTIRLIYLVGVLPWQVRTLLTDEQKRIKGAYAWVIGAAFCGAGTLIQSLGATIPGADITSAGRYSGFAQHISDTGGITAVAIAFCLAGSRVEMSKRRRRVDLIALAFASIGLLLSGSVSGLLAVAVTVAYLVLRRGVTIRRITSIALVGFVAFLVVGSIQSHTANALTPLQRVEQVTGINYTSPAEIGLDTSQSRIQTDRDGISGFVHHPIVGVGVDDLSGIVVPDGQLQVHNLLLGAAYQGGLILLIGLLMPIVAAFLLSLRDPSALGRQLNAAIVATFVFAMTAPSDYNRYFWIPIALALGTQVKWATSKQAAIEPAPATMAAPTWNKKAFIASRV